MADETLFIAEGNSRTIAVGLGSWAVRNGRRVRVQTGSRAGIEGTYVWFEANPLLGKRP